jgi:hypothetical protein
MVTEVRSTVDRLDRPSAYYQNKVRLPCPPTSLGPQD